MTIDIKFNSCFNMKTKNSLQRKIGGSAIVARLEKYLHSLSKFITLIALRF